MSQRKTLRRLILLIFALSISGCFLAIIHLTRIEKKDKSPFIHHQDRSRVDNAKDEKNGIDTPRWIKPAEKRITSVQNQTIFIKKHQTRAPQNVKLNQSQYSPNDCIHAFYYPWYGNPENDGEFLHWNHRYLPHWNAKQAKKWKSGQHVPTDDIGANFYPSLGCYSSRDLKVIDQHMQQMHRARVGVLVVSWYPPGKADNEGHPSDDIIPLLLDTADKYQLKVAFHSEPYSERNETTVKSDLKYIISTYGGHPALYRYGPKRLPLIYMYDSYLTPSNKWKSLLQVGGLLSIRGTEHDVVLIALLVEQKHQSEIASAGFDGFYTYFAASGFTYGSTYKNWPQLAKYAKRNGILFIPSIGPGYIDENIRPWNAQNTRPRNNGAYYEKAFENALRFNPAMISITSFNEWHEGSQIEPAVPRNVSGFAYLDYGKMGQDYYLDITSKWVEKFELRRQ